MSVAPDLVRGLPPTKSQPSSKAPRIILFGAFPTTGRPHRLVIEPLRPETVERSAFHWDDRRGALLFLDDADADEIGSRTRALQQIYGLTAAQAHVAEAISAGLSPEELADQSGTKISTVRTHVKRIFLKLGVTRMSALASIVLRLPATSSTERP